MSTVNPIKTDVFRVARRDLKLNSQEQNIALSVPVIKARYLHTNVLPKFGNAEQEEVQRGNELQAIP
jgi:hypothetical protein